MSNLFTISKSSNSSSSLSSSSSCISSGKEELESLFQELVPTEKKSIISYLKNNRIDNKQSYSNKMNISSEMVQIEEIRQQVNQLQQINQLLLPLIRQYEIVMDSDERLTIQHQITNTIQKGNSIAASSRVFYFLMKICSFQFKHSN